MVVLQTPELLDSLNALASNWFGNRFFGLFENELTITPFTTIAEIQPCTFPGYSGLQSVLGWNAPVLSGEFAVITALPLAWVRGAGGGPGSVVGYYVVDSSGVLRWAEVNPAGVTLLVTAGQVYPLTPSLSLSSRWGS